MSRIDTAEYAYLVAFCKEPPRPFAINDNFRAQVLEQAVEDGKPSPESFDWWRHLPPDANA